ncbi:MULTISPECIES: hypothetical protein [Haloarcula]|uniref:hypothetical protein n=1 Tax=Haloarcula TaxID=2237 RepID=UPI0011B6D0A2|nr:MULTISPECIES: hypothetical protein [Haloarcula]
MKRHRQASKFALILTLLGASATVLLFPIRYYISIISFSLLLLVAAYFLHRNPKASLAVFLLGLVMIRVYVYLSTPSMIGMDPDKIAVGVERIIQSGSTEAIGNLAFYEVAANFHVLAGVAGILMNTGGREALIISPILLTIVPSIAATAIARRFQYSGLIAGIITATASALGAWSIQPIPQGLAVPVVAIFLLASIVYIQEDFFNKGSSKILMTLKLLILLAALTFTHKLSLGFIAPIFVFATLFSRGNRLLGSFVIILSCLATLQWFFLTNFGWGLFNVILLPSIIGASFTTGAVDLSAASPVLGGLWGSILTNLHWLTLGAVAGVGWTFFSHRQYKTRDPSTQLLIATGMISAVLVAVAVFGPGIPYTRVILLAVVPFAIFSEVGVDRLPHVGTVVIVGLLILVQLTAPIASPDHPGQFRQYLTEEEQHAKGTIDGVTSHVSTDIYYARELHEISAERTYQTGEEHSLQEGWTPIGASLFNGNISNVKGDIVLRDINRYRMSGTQVLDYRPLIELRHRSIVYSSGNVRLISEKNYSQQNAEAQ